MTPSLYECDVKELAALFDLNCIPASVKQDTSGMQNAQRKAKQYRTTFPDKATQEAMRDCEQNSMIWFLFRAFSAGGSGLACLLGLDTAGYATNILLFLWETGRYCKAMYQGFKEIFAMIQGHYWESHIARIYSCLMGTTCYECGLILHWALPFLHISPDLLSHYLPGVYHNKYTVNDSRRGGGEIKAPIFHVYETQSGRHTIPTQYLCQVIAQLDTFLWQWCDFIVMNRARPDDNECLPVNVFEEKGHGMWHIGTTLVTRIYRNNKAAEIIIQYLRQHILHLKKQEIVFGYEPERVYTARAAKKTEQVFVYLRFNQSDEPTDNIQLTPSEFEIEPVTGSIRIPQHPPRSLLRNKSKWETMTGPLQVSIIFPPKLVEPVDLPRTTIVALKKVEWYLKASNPEQPYSAELNQFVGTVHPDIISCWNSKPIALTAHELLQSKLDLGIELDRLPAEDPEPKLCRISNPLFLEKLKAAPETKLSQIIWDFATAQNRVIDWRKYIS